MKANRVKKILYSIFPNLRLVEFSYKTIKCCFEFKKKELKMKKAVKVAIGSAVAFFFIIIVGFVVFPKLIKSQVKGMVNLKPGNDIRGMFVKVPFGLDFRVYMFNVTNPNEVHGGAVPIVKEIGPFCYQEWKTKINVEDNEENDTMNYNPVDTFYAADLGPDCLTGEEMITIPHPMILGMVNAVKRQKPGALTLINKALKSVYQDPPTIFVSAQAKNLLFDGLLVDCSVKDFAGKAVCSQLKATELPRLSENELMFSLMGPKNGTPGKKFQVYRGGVNSHDTGRIVFFDEKPEMENWPTKACNQIKGTDGTIFPPFLTKEEGLVSFAPDLCRSLVAFYVKNTKYDGIPVKEFTANLGDMSRNADEKCYCLTPDTCMKKGVMDLYKCAGLPIYASLPHFYESDPVYVNGVKGLSPDPEKHRISILFESTTGSPVYAKKRLQFSMPLEPNDKVDLFKTLPTTVLPLFWVEEGVELNNTFTKPLKDFFKINKIVKISKWVILLSSLGGMAGAAYMYFNDRGDVNITPERKVKPVDHMRDSISKINNEFGGQVNHAMSDNEIDKY